MARKRADISKLKLVLFFFGKFPPPASRHLQHLESTSLDFLVETVLENVAIASIADTCTQPSFFFLFYFIFIYILFFCGGGGSLRHTAAAHNMSAWKTLVLGDWILFQFGRGFSSFHFLNFCNKHHLFSFNAQHKQMYKVLHLYVCTHTRFREKYSLTL